MPTDDTIKDQVKDATDIVATIGQFVTLKKRGANYLGLCPFHTEKTPSFNVHPDRQFYHCFGCGKGGDVFTFLMEHEGWTFPEALKYCAQKAGITLPDRRDRDDGQSQLRQQIADALALADTIYRRALFADTGRHALAYLKGRGFKEATLKRAGVGYAPPGYDTVIKSAKARAISAQALDGAGLILTSSRDGEPYDRFRNRITFPIANLSGRTVGFGARALSDEDQPKYLNSPETAFYQKSRILYGLAVTREAVRRENRAVIVEGYLDWLSMIEFEIDNVVAVSGTALTDHQTQLLARFCRRVTLLFDADTAGQRATLRGIDVAFNAGLGVDVAILPAGEDPDTLLRKQGVDRMREILNTATGIVEYRIQVARNESGGRLDFLARERLVKELVELAAKITDATRRETFLNEASNYLEVDETHLRKLLRAVRRPDTDRQPRVPVRSAVDRREEEFLRVLVGNPAFIDEARTALTPDDFEITLHQQMFASVLSLPVGELADASPTDLGADPDQIAAWARVFSYEIDSAVERRVFDESVREFQSRRRQADKPRIKELIAQAERAGDRETVNRLMAEFERSLHAAP